MANHVVNSSTTPNLMPHIRITHTTLQHVKSLETLQTTIYPMLSARELLTAAKYRNHLRLFPEGQFVALATVDKQEQVIGATSTFRVQFDFGHPQHRFVDIVDEGWLTHHDPQGEWLYGVGTEVHPNYRRMGIGGKLYAARRELIRRLNIRGEVTGGMLPGYKDYKDMMSIEQFVWQVAIGKAYCPTLTMQLKNGFRVVGVLYNYVTDPDANNCSSLLIRENPDYIPRRVAPMPIGTYSPLDAPSQFAGV